jgi:hypothetical protein
MTNESSVSDIARLLNEDAERFACHVLGEKPTSRSRREVRFFPKGGLSVTISGPRKGNWIHYAEEGAFGDMLDLYKWRVGATMSEAIEFAKSWLGISDGADLPKLPEVSKEDLEKELEEDERKRVSTAQWLWNKSKPAEGTPAVTYLKNRGIDIELPDCIRYRHIGAKDLEKMNIDKEAFPDGLDAAVFLATNLAGEVRAVQTILIHEGRKAKIVDPKRSNGSLNGAAVKLGQPTDKVVLAEGPETGLSVWLATGIPTWIVLGTANFSRVEIPESVREIIIAVDIEQSGFGLAAALRSACYWRSQGKVVRLAIPADGDFNDVLQESGRGAVKTAIESAVAPTVNAARDDFLILCVSARDALAAWLATGANVRATVKEMRPDRHIPEEVTDVIALARPGETLPDFSSLLEEGGKAKRLNSVRYVRPSWMSVEELYRVGGEAAVRSLIEMATPHGLETLYGIEFVALKPNGRIVVNQSRKAADMAATLLPADACLAYNAGQSTAAAYDWSPLADREVYLAPSHCPKGIEQAAAAAARAKRQGASRVAMIEWPLFVITGNGYEVRHRRLPRAYDMCAAANDGWSAANAGALLDLAAPLA